MTEIEKLTAGHPDTQSADIVEGNIQALRALFPEAFTEGKIDFEVLKQCLGGALDEREEKYGLNWHGKRRARQIALTPSTGTLLPCPEDSVDWDTTQNLMIEGDNLEVLKLLQKSYAGKVKLIYIDPPYNTGNDFVYPDDFRDSIRSYLELTGQVEGGRKIASNADASGRFHTEWANMMLPRIKLARSLLKKDGFICVSIDDVELPSATFIMNEVFGEECFMGRIVRATGTTTGQDSGGLGRSFDYVLVYARDPDAVLSGIPLDEGDEKRFQDEDARGKYSVLQLRKTGNADRREDRPSMFYPVNAPDGTEVFPIGPGGYQSRWRFGPDRYKQSVEDDLIVWKQVERDGKKVWSPYVKYYLEGRMKRPSPLWDDIDGNKKATIEVRELLGDRAFNNPKPTQLLLRLIQMTFGDQREGVVLDFFAGSGTTAHATLSYNALNDTSLRYVLVQLPEPIGEDSREQLIAARVCDRLGRPKNIAELTKERIRRAAAAVSKSSSLTKDSGFRVYKLAPSCICSWEPNTADLEGTLLDHAEHLLPGRTEADILTELLLKLGLDLCVPIETKDIAGKFVHSVGAGALIVCLSDGITREAVEGLAQGIVAWWQVLAPTDEDKSARNTSVVFKDSGFADDVAKTNMAAILSQAGIKNMRSL